MPAEIIQSNYEQLDTIAQRFRRQADATVQMQQRVEKALQALQNGGWQGKGAAAFLGEMDGKVLPVMRRLHTALQQAQRNTLEIKQLIQAAEEQAAAPFRSGETKSISTNDSGAVSFSDGASNQNSSPPDTNTQPAVPASPIPTTEQLQQELEQFRANRPPRSPTTTYPKGVWSVFTSPAKVTEHEAKMLDDLDLLEKNNFREIRNEASDFEQRYFGSRWNNDGPGDAFRHATWSALLTREFGEKWATEYTNAHEELPGNQSAREFMDRRNNALGIKIAIANPNANPEELAAKVADAIRRGEGVYIPGANQYPLNNPIRDTIAETGPVAPTNQQLGEKDLLPRTPTSASTSSAL